MCIVFFALDVSVGLKFDNLNSISFSRKETKIKTKKSRRVSHDKGLVVLSGISRDSNCEAHGCRLLA